MRQFLQTKKRSKTIFEEEQQTQLTKQKKVVSDQSSDFADNYIAVANSI